MKNIKFDECNFVCKDWVLDAGYIYECIDDIELKWVNVYVDEINKTLVVSSINNLTK